MRYAPTCALLLALALTNTTAIAAGGGQWVPMASRITATHTPTT